MANFYVTLPSNASMDIYPDNAISHYRTQLRQPLKLDGQWEVAIVETSIPTRWQNVTRDHFIRVTLTSAIDQETKYFRAEVEADFYDSPAQLQRALNRAWLELKKTISQEPGFRDLTPRLRTAFLYDNVDNIITLHHGAEIPVQVSANLGLILGIGDGEKEWVRVPTNKRKAAQMLNMTINVNHMFIYSDIVEYTIVGDVVAPLLRVIPMQSYIGNNRIDHYTHIFNSPHYVPVSRQHIESINIDIRNDTGENVPFVAGKSIVKLHFRRRKPL